MSADLELKQDEVLVVLTKKMLTQLADMVDGCAVCCAYDEHSPNCWVGSCLKQLEKQRP